MSSDRVLLEVISFLKIDHCDLKSFLEGDGISQGDWSTWASSILFASVLDFLSQIFFWEVGK